MLDITKKEMVESILREALVLNGFEDYKYEEEYIAGSDIESLYHYGSPEKQPEGFTIELEAQFGGEGEGDTYYVVISILDNKTKGKIYVRFDAWYDSWNGTEWDGWDFVKPVEVKVIEWEIATENN